MSTNPPPALRDRANYPFLVLFAFLPFVLYMHHSKIAPRGLDIDDTLGQFTYYHADLIFLVGIVCLLWLIKPLRHWSLALITPLYYIATFDWLSWHTQNKSFFFADVYRGIQLLIYYPEFVTALPSAFKLKAVILLSLPILLTVLFRLSWMPRLAQGLHKPANLLAGCAVVASLAPLPWTLSSAYLHQNSITHMMSEQLHDRKLQGIAADRTSMREPLGHGVPAQPSGLHAGGPTHDNVIVFIIETAPYPQYPELRELAAALEHPWLKHNSIVFTQHFATYPASDRTCYSILSGQYPPMLHHNGWKGGMHYGDSLPKALARQGYTSYLFSTAPLSFYDDDLMFRNLGFTHLQEVEKAKSLRVKTATGYQWDRSRLYEMDEELIQMVIDALGQHSNGAPAAPFLAAITPQSSHAPFNCPPESRQDATACQTEAAKIRTNAKWQFGLIERLIQALEKAGQLDNTLLVITGDHGIRSKHEASFFQNPNLLQQSTFHVPMMLASSRLGNLPRQIDNPTTHVDIAPTVLDLLGIPREDLYFHGRNLFTNTPRTIYFIGTGYLPVTGFLQDDRYYMENRSNELFLSSPAMDFNDRSQTNDDSATRSTIDETLLKLEAFLRREYPTATPL